MPDDRTPASQTLSRGLTLLEVLAEDGRPLTIDDLAGRAGIHRSVAYRLLTTLEDHGLAVRDAAGRVTLGSRLAALAAGVARDLQTEALPELTTAANDLGMTCFIAMLDHDECVTLVSVEPRHAVAVAQRPGTVHAVARGAPGKALLMQLPEASWPADADGLSPAIAAARITGYATSHDEVVPSLSAVAVPLALRGYRPATLAAVYLVTPRRVSEVAERLLRAADSISEALGS